MYWNERKSGTTTDVTSLKIKKPKKASNNIRKTAPGMYMGSESVDPN